MQVVQVVLTFFEGKVSLGRNAQASDSSNRLLTEFQVDS